ncbi:MAG: uroporphyrinogen-III synthase [Microbacteriaceae bacterium]|nr:uroporphyrinogen-III synthase [Microbacteriaceae bacterium]
MTLKDAELLNGQRVLVPRSGAWGSLVAKALQSRGATPIISPLVDFAHTQEQDELRQAFAKLEDGYFDWVTATNATIVDLLSHNNVKINERTKVAIVGEATYAAFIAAGYDVARWPEDADPSAAGLLKVWPEIDAGNKLRVLTMRSDTAKPVLTDGLVARGHDVTQVIAYRTVGVPASIPIREDVESGYITALLVASPQIAREVATQFPQLPESTALVCVGDTTSAEAAQLGLAGGDSASAEIVAELQATVLDALDPADMLD